MDIDQLRFKFRHEKDKHQLKVFIIKYILKYNIHDVEEIIESLKFKEGD